MGIIVPGAREVLAAAESGDALARQVWDDAVRSLAEQLALAGDLSDQTAALADEMLVTTMKDLP
ncbi:hypothetical protein [Mycetocola sp.]|uniref:hypothetical protein n=1 Tax=Mycetocola sp. TaxID=1871042 RepID=UPI003988AEAA